MAEKAETTPAVPKVLIAIHEVMKDLAKAGVGKNKTNTSQNFQYRGVDDVMDALAQSLSKHDLLIMPSVVEHTFTERKTRNGGDVLHALLKLNYEFTCPVDGSTKVSGPWYGEAMDTGDKSTSKAMAIAYKYFAVQTFCIPITGMDDPDGQSHEIAKEAAQAPAARARAPDTKGSDARVDARTEPASPSGEPACERPSGAFDYGKTYRDVPWDLMKIDQLSWFLEAERTPQRVREKIVHELEWREYLEAQYQRQIAAETPVELSDEIP